MPLTAEQATGLERIAAMNGRPSGFMRTDLGNAERLVAAHGDDLRHVPGIGGLWWDGRRWRHDGDGEFERRAKATVRSIYEEAATSEDRDEREALAKWASRSESEPRIKAMVSLARTEAAIVASADALDAHPFLLNVQNGTLDLSTGELCEHRRENLLTKLAPVAWMPCARDAAWTHFLERTSGGDAELAGFLRRAAGYSLTGDTGEEVLFFAHGPEATGKSTFLEALKAMLGDYAATADFDTFLARRGEGPRNDVARLAGARLVASVEVDEGKRLAEGLVKQLTGGDTVSARFLFREAFEFRPVFKLWLAANARPRISAEDGAIWRRILQVPFTETVPEHERDPDLKRHLKTNPGARSAILAWAVAGCLEWQRRGLVVPERVRDYTAAYRAENDPFAEWLDGRCRFAPGATSPAAELRASYESWVVENGEQPRSATAMGKALTASGCERVKLAGDRAWRGIELKQVDR